MTEVNRKFKGKTLEVFNLMETVPDWEEYVEEKTANVLKFLKETQDPTKTENEFNMPKITIRSHVLRAIKRINNKETFYRFGARSELATELFDLMDNTPNWEEYVTPYEAQLALKFKEVKNFYELGRMLGLNDNAGNLAGTLYGNTQKLGVITKIKEGIKQTDRRNYTVLSKDQDIEDLHN